MSVVNHRCAVLGKPIAHSLSPVLHNAAYRALGLDDWTYDRHEVGQDDLDGFLHGLDPSWVGLSLTMPLKKTIQPYGIPTNFWAMQLGVANLSAQAYEPVLMHLPPYLSAQAQPAVLQPGEKGVIRLTLDTERLTDLGLTQTSVYLSRFTGDKVGEENELPLSAIILPDFSGLTDTERANAPSVSLSTDRIDLSEALAHKRKAKADVTLTNTGQSPLHISQLQVFHPAVGVRLKKSVLQPGESTRLRITITRRGIGRHRRHLRVLMITNDPAHPKVEINITAHRR